jgi:hypothetical protein
MAKSPVDKLLRSHPKLTHSTDVKVISHVQRAKGDWILNTLMLYKVEVPFKYKRKKHYKDLSGARVNLTYYPATENIAGFDIEIMNVVRIKMA